MANAYVRHPAETPNGFTSYIINYNNCIIRIPGDPGTDPVPEDLPLELLEVRDIPAIAQPSAWDDRENEAG